MNRDELIAHLRAHLTAVKSGLPATHTSARLSVNVDQLDALFAAHDALAAATKPAAPPVEVKT